MHCAVNIGSLVDPLVNPTVDHIVLTYINTFIRTMYLSTWALKNRRFSYVQAMSTELFQGMVTLIDI